MPRTCQTYDLVGTLRITPNEDAAMYQIEKNIPIVSGNKGGNAVKYPWRDMEVGDSFVIDKSQTRASGLCVSAGRSLGMKFKTHGIDATHTRIWRVA